MSTSETELARWQFDLSWALFDHHLQRLAPDDFLWEPGPLCWTLDAGPDGSWIPDWADTEPDPVPVPTIGWLSWHIGWWWSVTMDHARGRTPREREEIHWPGPGEPTIAWLRALRDEWLDILGGLDPSALAAPVTFPWGEDSPYTGAHQLAWVNTELTKNAAEIGQLRLLRTAATAAPA
ncbi:DinB family protein [Streptomyces sp. NBRC 109706]|uniref:DinB family protein n=1 Tax=Streptomyces sp. NBRC 109706 TaxID=1550035 RepID=UPI000780BCBD|nr:DinB family protein [Streptomyces sp. NBRC 109706]